MREFQEPVATGRSLPVGHLEYSSCVGAKVAEAVPLRTQCAQWGIRHVRADFVTRGTLSEVGPDYVVVIRSDLKTCIGITSPLKCPADSTLPEDRECSVCLNAQIPSCLAHMLLPTLSTLRPLPLRTIGRVAIKGTKNGTRTKASYRPASSGESKW